MARKPVRTYTKPQLDDTYDEFGLEAAILYAREALNFWATEHTRLADEYFKKEGNPKE